ncbi:hypothetical protein [Mesorhizobium sp. LNJC384A00]|uniref:hypothetical protein n=1 Tax=Mesorhizobium sp. LNJC384A00 TaxID=1287268 RepID=UPI001FDA7A0A|nr:hypothetical protein [Mesorhizobium sp. LNJC384A00]
MQFYAVFPAVMLLVRRLDWIRSALVVAAIGCVIVFAMRLLSIHFPMPSFLPLKMQIFLCGMLLGRSRASEPAAIYPVLGTGAAAGGAALWRRPGAGQASGA